MPPSDAGTPRRRSARLSATPEPTAQSSAAEGLKSPRPSSSVRVQSPLEEEDDDDVPQVVDEEVVRRVKRTPSRKSRASKVDRDSDRVTASTEEEVVSEEEERPRRSSAKSLSKPIKLHEENDGAPSVSPDQHKSARSIQRRRLLLSRLRLGFLGTLLPPLLLLVGYLLPLALPIPPFAPYRWRDANNGISRGTYVDENALQPGQAYVYFDYDTDVKYADSVADAIVELGFPPEARPSNTPLEEQQLPSEEETDDEPGQNVEETQVAKVQLDKSLLGRMTTEQRNYITEALVKLGLKPLLQDYSYQVGVPSKGSEVADTKSETAETRVELALDGTNIIAKFSSPRADSREAFVLAASWFSSYDGTEPEDPDAQEGTVFGRRRVNVRGVASVLALARFLTTQSYLSRDIVFVISDGHLAGMQAFLSSFYASNQTNLHTSLLTPSGKKVDDAALGGSMIWNALAIDYPSDSFKAIEVLHEGLNGQLPNQDTFNTVVKVAEFVDGVPVRLPGLSSTSLLKAVLASLRSFVRVGRDIAQDFSGQAIWDDQAENSYSESAEGILRQLGLQTVGRTTGIHGLFTRYHIDAVTIRAVPAPGPYGFWHMGRIAEGSIRAYNNLLERLHHSQFFYILTTPHRFVQFGVYIPGSILISVGLTFLALKSWSRLSEAAHERTLRLYSEIKAQMGSNGKASSFSSDLPLERPTTEHMIVDLLQLSGLQTEYAFDAGRIAEIRRDFRLQSRPVGLLLSTVAGCHLIGLLGLRILARAQVGCAEDALLTCKPFRTSAILITGSSLLLALITARMTAAPARKDAGATLHSFAMLHAGMLTAVGSVLNFPQAYTTAATLGLPLALFSSRTSASKIKAVASTVLFFFLLPFVGVTAVERTLSTPLVTDLLKTQLSILTPQAIAIRQAIDLLLWEWRVLRAVFIPYLMLGYVPVVLEAFIAALLDLFA